MSKKSDLPTNTPERTELANLQRQEAKLKNFGEWSKARKAEVQPQLEAANKLLQEALATYRKVKPTDAGYEEALKNLRATSQARLDILSLGTEWEHQKLLRETENRLKVLRRLVNKPKEKSGKR
jgi:hypothetical protein